METGLISIVMPSYNCSSFIKETVDTVISQTYKNWELIIVDDCSTDDTLMVLKQLTKQDSRIQYIKLEKNSGAAVARNMGIAVSKGEYIAFLDSDDLWREDKLEKQVAFMTDNKCKFSFTGYDLVDKNGNSLNKIVYAPNKISYDRLLYDTPVFTSTVMYNRSFFKDERMPVMKNGEDVAMWLQMVKKVPYACGLQECLVSYKKRDASLSSGVITKLKRRWAIYRVAEKIPLYKACILYIQYLFCVIRKRKSLKE